MASMHPTTDDYPRPDFDRSHRWLSLNGDWDFSPDPDDRGLDENWARDASRRWPLRITVPFPWESPRSGVGYQQLPVGWYRRTIARPAAWADERVVLHVGAAMYACQCWVNGELLGEHTGGYLPFSFDITDALRDGEGVLTLRVETPLDKRFIPHGKQHSQPPDDYDGCCFTPSSGIWQPVWLEGRPATYVERLDLRPTADLASIDVDVRVAGPRRDEAHLIISVPDHGSRTIDLTNGAGTLTIPIDRPRLWSPRQPHLYEVEARLTSADGEDRVRGQTGLRRIETRGDRILLNGEPVYLRGVLDQGFWPESGYAAPDGAALRRDVELALAAGYNLVRKHIKLEDPRWLSWADRLGLLVWAEPPCTGRYSREAIARYEAQLAPWTARDGNHPSIVLWGLYNEEWGLDWRVGEDTERQQAVERAYDRLHALDDSRPIIDNSGWWHVKTDILDWHYYDNNIGRWAQVTEALANDAATWFGHGLGKDHWYETQLSVEGRDHGGLPLMNGEYGGGDTALERGWHLRWQTQELRRHPEMVGYIYTELFDIEHELCGIYTDARVMKDLDCDPAAVNAETVLIFDTIPLHRGCDVVTSNGNVRIDVRVSHQHPEPFSGELAWGWDRALPVGRVTCVVAPFEISAPMTLTCTLPAGVNHERLHVWVSDQSDARPASTYLDVVRGEGEPANPAMLG